MNLPFLKSRKLAQVIIARKKPEGGIEPMHAEDEQDPALMSAADDLISAVHMKDSKAVADALQAAFEICDSMPHEEGQHLDMDEDMS
jgi:hypothetical protein